MSDQSKKIPWEAFVGLALAAIAAFALFRPATVGKPNGGGRIVGEAKEKASREHAATEAGAENARNAAASSADVPSAAVSSADELAAELRVKSEPRIGIKPDDVAVFMRAKLDHAQDVIEGLATENYQAIYRAAHDLALASQASTWEVLLTEEYARQSADFRRSCEALRAAARDENLDAAALAWMEVTMKCVQCHKYVRQADVTAPAP